MSRSSFLALFLGVLLANVGHAQTVDEILAKHYETQGGLEKMKSVTSRRMVGTMGMGMPGMEAPITLEQKRPAKRRIEFTIQGMTGVQAFDGEKGWSFMPFMGQTDPEVSSDEDSSKELDESDFDGVLVDYKAKGHAIEYVGKEMVEGAEAFKLKVTKKNGDIEYQYLDAETYLVVKTEGKTKRRGTEVEVETVLSDYKEVDGVMVPFAMEMGAKGQPMRQKMTFSKIEMNVPIEDARFALPAKTAPAKDAKAPEKKKGE
jgi:outer membrane lipoprotein-sorting protein